MPASDINVARTGSGTPLVLIHGIGHRWQAWEPVLHELSRRHDVIAVDLPGFGESPMPAAGLAGDMPSSVKALAVFLEELGVDRPHVAGNSLGGAMALEMAAAGWAASATAFAPAGFFARGHRARALTTLRVLRATAFLPEPVLRTALRSKLVRAMSFGPLVARPSHLSMDRMVDDALALRRGRGFERVARAGLKYRFSGAPSVPVTIAWGDKDRILPPSEATIAAARLPRATHLTLPGCGHVPMSDDPELVARTILTTTSRTD